MKSMKCVKFVKSKKVKQLGCPVSLHGGRKKTKLYPIFFWLVAFKGLGTQNPSPPKKGGNKEATRLQLGEEEITSDRKPRNMRKNRNRKKKQRKKTRKQTIDGSMETMTSRRQGDALEAGMRRQAHQPRLPKKKKKITADPS